MCHPFGKARAGMGLGGIVGGAGLQCPLLQLRVGRTRSNDRDIPHRPFPFERLEHGEPSGAGQGQAEHDCGKLVRVPAQAVQRGGGTIGLYNLIDVSECRPDRFVVSGILVYNQQRPGRQPSRIPLPVRFEAWRGGFPLQQGLEVTAGKRLGKIVSLYVIAANLPQAFQLLPGLHPFRDHTQVHRTGKPHNEAQNPLVERLCRLTLDEFHVQLQDIQGI